MYLCHYRSASCYSVASDTKGENQRALCICVDKQHPLVLPGKSDAEVGGGRGLAHVAPFDSSPRSLCNSPYGFSFFI